ncbi:MAG: SURF1 family cytochrome oxidase biogenesis protein, partial [Actinomycetes bacterium]
IGLAVFIAAVSVLFMYLGFWQFGLYTQHEALNQQITARGTTQPAPLTAFDAVGRPVTGAEQWHQVSVTGQFDTDHQLIVRNRPQNGAPGYDILTPLVTAEGSAVIVNRGWLAVGTTSRLVVPPPPSGIVTVAGRLRISENESGPGAKDNGRLPANQIQRIDLRLIATKVPYPLYGGYIMQSSPAPVTGLLPVTVPSVSTGMYLSYAFQWWLFAVVVLVGFVLLVRQEARGVGLRRILSSIPPPPRIDHVSRRTRTGRPQSSQSPTIIR